LPLGSLPKAPDISTKAGKIPFPSARGCSQDSRRPAEAADQTEEGRWRWGWLIKRLRSQRYLNQPYLKRRIRVMGQKLERVIPAIAVAMCAMLFPMSHASAQGAPVSLREQLAAQYKAVKMGSDSGGYSVVEPGTLLAVQKGGILGVPYSDSSVLSTKYEGGVVRSPNSLLTKGIGFGMGKVGKVQATRLFQVGEKVYPSKLEVDVGKDEVAMTIVACDICNRMDPPTYNKAKVVFHFPKGTLAKASAGEVEDTIGQLLPVAEDAQQDQGGQGQVAQEAPDAPATPRQAAETQPESQPEPQPEPKTIQLGMTTDQVVGTLGKPSKIVNLGAKQLYIYKDMKVTFLNGKVADVQ
jgi:hypothetical protein